MDRRKFWDIIILILVFIACVMFPINIITQDMWIRIYVRIGLLVFFIAFTIFFAYVTKIAHLFQGKSNVRNILLLLPLYVVAFCNLFFLTVIQKGTVGVIWNLEFGLYILLALLTAFAEELLFRFVIQKNLTFQSKLVKILIASAIFTVCHIFTIISYWDLTNPSSWNWFELTMLGYTFYIGVCLGFLYEYTNNLVMPIIFHFFFNLINNVWFGVSEWTVPYLINCLCFAAYGVAYLCLFYFVFTKRENR